MSFCVKCGKKIAKEDEFCSNCGKQIIEDIDKEIEGLKVKTEHIEKNSESNVKDIIGYIFVLIILIIIIFLVLTKNSGEGVTLISKAKLWLNATL